MAILGIVDVRVADMRLRRGLVLLALGGVLLSRAATGAELVTDANIVTALDISESVDPQAITTEIEGMAEAIRAPAFVRAVQDGQHGRIGFAIFAWRDGAYPELVSWTTIASAADARAVSGRLQSDFRAFAASDQPAAADAPHMTDLSGAIDHAAILLLTAPFATDKSIVNVIGNGWDNVGEGPQRARDRIVAQGGTVNGVILGFDPVLMGYYRSTVIGGPGAFLLSVDDPAAMSEVLARKFLYDVVQQSGGDASRIAARSRR